MDERENNTAPTTTTKLSYGYTYIHTYMEKRKRTDDTTDSHVVFYDKKDLTNLKITALRNNTDVSSIISNLVREFNLSTSCETPQKTLFNFEEDKLCFHIEPDDMSNHLKSLNEKKLQEIEYMLQTWNARYNKEKLRRGA